MCSVYLVGRQVCSSLSSRMRMCMCTVLSESDLRRVGKSFEPNPLTWFVSWISTLTRTDTCSTCPIHTCALVVTHIHIYIHIHSQNRHSYQYTYAHRHAGCNVLPSKRNKAHKKKQKKAKKETKRQNVKIILQKFKELPLRFREDSRVQLSPKTGAGRFKYASYKPSS